MLAVGGATWLILGIIASRKEKKWVEEAEQRRKERETNENILKFMNHLHERSLGENWNSELGDWGFTSFLEEERLRTDISRLTQMGVFPEGITNTEEWINFLSKAIPIVERDGYKEVIRRVESGELLFPF